MTALPSSSNTPEGVSIKARNMSFKIEQALATDWADNDAFLTAIFNAMSISFPSGEKNFIDSVRVYQDRIEDPKLRSEVKGFFKQEGIHSREHRKYNQLLCQQRGYDLEKLEGVYLNRIEASKNDPKITNRVMLASTVAVEHFTASFGESFLQGKLVKNVEGPLGDLWRWHSLEELEHKSVAFDVYRQIGGDNKMRRMCRPALLNNLISRKIMAALGQIFLQCRFPINRHIFLRVQQIGPMGINNGIRLIEPRIKKHRAQYRLTRISQDGIGQFRAVLNPAIGFQHGGDIPSLRNFGAGFATDKLAEAAR